jgi:peptidoglycan-N-acetylglucosamine deacetylase
VPILSLTFDDGPDPKGTPELLDVLAELDARVTFFPIAPRAVAEPALIERMLADGHAIGLHCYEHVRHSEQQQDAVSADTAGALTALRALGARPAYWRTPWGDLAPFTQRVAAEHELQLIGWTVDTNDWRGDSATEMFERTRPGLRDGAVVLAHDGIGPGALRDGIEQTIELTRLIGAYARERGLLLEALV